MPDLIQRAARFRARRYAGYGHLFEELSLGQDPHTLFISCSDSRVDPNLITGSLPGELFVVRNIANIVPDFAQAVGDAAVSSAIEYAVQALRVENIVVCGHSNCGGCKAMCSGAGDQLPLTRRWLQFAGDMSQAIPELQQGCSSTAALAEVSLRQVELHNIILQLKSLLSYPYISSRRDAGELRLYGWHYDISSGCILNYDWERSEFREIPAVS